MSDVIEAGSEERTGALMVIPAAQLPTIMAAQGAADILARLVEELSGFQGDATTEKGRREIASKARKAAVSKMDLVRLAGTLKETAQKTIKGVNAEIKIVEERMDALRDSIRAPLDEFEARETARVAGHEQAIATIEGWGAVPEGWTAEQIAARIAELDNDPLRDRDWQEFKGRAQRAATNSFNALKVALADAERREAEAAEQARRAAAEAEQQRQAAEAARREHEARIAAEAAERARQAAEQKAAQEAAEAERRAQAEREAAARREQEARAAAERAEQERQAAERRAAELERARVTRHKELIAAIAEDPAWGPTESSSDIGRRLAYLRQIDVDRFEEFAGDAQAVINAEIALAESFLPAAQQREAKAAAQAAEAERVAREEQAERDRQAAAAAERQRIEAEREAERKVAEERERNVAHRRRIERQAVTAIVAAMAEDHSGSQDEAMKIASAIVTAIHGGKVPHVSITY